MEKVFENEHHQTSLMEGIKSMYDEQVLTDVILRVEKTQFHCHRNVLAATSPYFHAMFTTDLTESRQNIIDLYEVESDAVQCVIDYAYTGRVLITKYNAQNLLVTSSLFQISPICNACAKFMEANLSIANCMGVYMFANFYDCNDLLHKVSEFVEKNFTDVCQTEEFLSVTVDQLCQIISSDDLNVDKEEIVYDAILRWIIKEEGTREEDFATLLPHIRMTLLNSKYIHDHISSNKIVQSNQKCLQILDDLAEFEQHPDTYKGQCTFALSLRSGMIKPENCILFIGGLNLNIISKPAINCYNPLTREAFSMQDFPHLELSQGHYVVEDPACIVTDDNLIFVAGGNYVYRDEWMDARADDDSIDGLEEETVRKDFYQYDNDHNTWVGKASMLFAKSNFTMACLDNKIYCFGGLTVHQHPTEIIECYDILKNRWSYMGMMPVTLVDLSSVTHDGSIYLLGGRTGVGAHNVVMRYESYKAEWTSLAGMPTPRFRFGACVIDAEIYVAGGQIYSQTSHTVKPESLRSVEIYNIHENQWRQGPELPENTYNVGLFYLSNTLFACGTTSYFQRRIFEMYRYNVVYKLDMVKGDWEKIESDLFNTWDYVCVNAKMQTRKLSRVFRPEVDT